MSTRFDFQISATSGAARTGTIRMLRGEIRTPAFMPVGTAATVKGMKPQDVRAAGDPGGALAALAELGELQLAHHRLQAGDQLGRVGREAHLLMRAVLIDDEGQADLTELRVPLQLALDAGAEVLGVGHEDLVDLRLGEPEGAGGGLGALRVGRAQREPVRQQGLGHLHASQHKMQVVQRRARQKRNIFKGFSACRGDPGGHPG